MKQPSAAKVKQTSPYAAQPWLSSYPKGVPTSYSFPSFGLTRLLDDATASFPDHTALAFLGAKTSYRQLKEQVDRFAGALRGLGVQKGDRVAIVLPNCPQNVVAFFATLRLGAVVVEHNPLYTEAELKHQLADCGAKIVVCLDRVYSKVAAVQQETDVQHVVVTSLLDELPLARQVQLRLPLAKARKARAELAAAVPSGVKRYSALLKSATPVVAQVAVDQSDVALLQYTGGTTGLSKGAMLSHGNLVSNAYMNRLWDTHAVAGKEVTLAVLPLFHAYGLTVAMTNTILLGGTLVLLPRFDLDLVFKAIDTWKPTLFPGVPPIYKAIADSPKAKDYDLSSIRLCISGAMKLPVEVSEQFTKISGATLIEGYGMTETSPSTHANPTSGGGKLGTIGVPLPGTSCKVVDQESSGREVPVGSPGELAIAGPQVFSGYWNRPDQDGVFTSDGYLLTGDIAVMDEEGYFTIVDRKKELIIAGGFNIYPTEVEEVLFSLKGVQDVGVVGIPDRYRGETVKAYVVRSPGADLTEDDVVAHAAASLTAYKVPKVVEFRDSLPRTPVGKLLRRVLLEEEKAKATPAAKKAGTPKAAAKSAPAATTPVKKAPAKKAAPAKNAAAKVPAAKVPAAEAPAKVPAKVPAKKGPAAKQAPAKAAKAVAVKVAPAKATTKAPARKAAAKKV
ncbi:MAG: AMP-binding protein [Actinomycetota bacterium]|nr:AMP-binding protein [Actinomycetota bacterium]